jgi:hypothetical protein
VTINTIFCGNDRDRDAESWNRFASYAGGAFLTINTDRPVVIPTTPYDAKINEYGSKINKTYLPYGQAQVREEKVKNQMAQDANAQELGVGVAAGRNVVKAGTQYRNDSWDLCDRVKNDKDFDLSKLPESELPESLRKLSPSERLATVQKMLAEREQISKEIAELNKKRLAYIAEEQKKQARSSAPGLDDGFRKVLTQQVRERGLTLSDQP